MAGVFVLMAFGGFTPTYWARVASGTFHGPPILHIHGALLFSWTLFYIHANRMDRIGAHAHPPRVGPGGNSPVQRHDVFDPRRADNRRARGRRARVWRRGTPIRCRGALRFTGVDRILFPGDRQRATIGNAQAADVPHHGGVYASSHRARSAGPLRPAGGARTTAGVRSGATGLDRRSADRRS